MGRLAGIVCSGCSPNVDISFPELPLLVPILFFILLGSMMYSLSLPNASKGVAYLFQPRWSQFSDISVWIDALSQVCAGVVWYPSLSNFWVLAG